jgi:pimeloyl-ACP methyl ester carboxylesterase
MGQATFGPGDSTGNERADPECGTPGELESGVNRRVLVAFGPVVGLMLTFLSIAIPVALASPPSIVAVPIQVARTSAGVVSYRSVGSGRPLLLIMGFGGSQDAWTPTLVNALAKGHRVIIFDNAGVGQTTTPSGKLTISAMADQTAALIETLHLHDPDVMGWSLGGMIAQALVVRHPGDVRRLVLCSTVLGNGNATKPSSTASLGLYESAVSNNVNALMSWIFPPRRLTTDSTRYLEAVTKYPNFYLPSPAADRAQYEAANGWINGAEQAGHGRIEVPTLIGHGADDAIFSPTNARKLGRAIAGARVIIYPGAGHAFLMIQYARAWAARVNAFLS